VTEDGDQDMDDEEPAAVDARSVYIGNVSSSQLSQYARVRV